MSGQDTQAKNLKKKQMKKHTFEYIVPHHYHPAYPLVSDQPLKRITVTYVSEGSRILSDSITIEMPLIDFPMHEQRKLLLLEIVGACQNNLESNNGEKSFEDTEFADYHESIGL